MSNKQRQKAEAVSEPVEADRPSPPAESMDEAPEIEQEKSIPAADSIVVTTESGADVDVPPVALQEKRPSELQMAVLAHGTLSGMQRTKHLQDLRVAFGSLAVDETIVDMIRLGFFDNGQVLTPKGALILKKYGR